MDEAERLVRKLLDAESDRWRKFVLSAITGAYSLAGLALLAVGYCLTQT